MVYHVRNLCGYHLHSLASSLEGNASSSDSSRCHPGPDMESGGEDSDSREDCGPRLATSLMPMGLSSETSKGGFRVLPGFVIDHTKITIRNFDH